MFECLFIVCWWKIKKKGEKGETRELQKQTHRQTPRTGKMTVREGCFMTPILVNKTHQHSLTTRFTGLGPTGATSGEHGVPHLLCFDDFMESFT